MALRAHRHAEIRHFVRSSGAAAYFIPDRVGSFDYRPMAAEMAGEFPSLRHVVVVGEPGPGQARCIDSLSSERPADDGLLDERRPDPSECLDDAAVGRDDLAVEADSADPQRLRLQRAASAPRSPDSPPTPCSWPCCRWATTTTWHVLACSASSTPAARSSSRRSTDAGEVFTTVARERVTDMAAVVPLITTWLNGERREQFDRLVAAGRAERRRAAGAGAARASAPGVRLHAAGDLRHRRRSDQHDAADRRRRPAAESSGAPVSEWDEIAVLDDAGA